MTGLVQLRLPNQRRLALVEGDRLRLLEGADTIYELAMAALSSETSISELARRFATGASVDYSRVYSGESEWRILPAADHPSEPARCLVTGTGLTHLASVSRRDAMHAGVQEVTDSMRMYQWGVEGGKPQPGCVGTAPEWFYKGDGSVLRAHGEALLVPSFAEDGGEEPEIAGVYIIAPDGTPFRIGLAAGNEFSDHIFEKRNYLYLAASKLRTCSIGPELILDHPFDDVTGEVRILRQGAELWSSPLRTGERNMCHSLQNLEHHHFKFPQHRRPGDVHIHFFGADAFSFGSGIQLRHGDEVEIRFEGFGYPLRNRVEEEPKSAGLVCVKRL